MPARVPGLGPARAQERPLSRRAPAGQTDRWQVSPAQRLAAKPWLLEIECPWGTGLSPLAQQPHSWIWQRELYSIIVVSCGTTRQPPPRNTQIKRTINKLFTL